MQGVNNMTKVIKGGIIEQKNAESFFQELIGIVKGIIIALDDGEATPKEMIEKVANIVNAVIDIPYVPEFLEGIIIHSIIEAVYDGFLAPKPQVKKYIKTKRG